jgi:hypothetical protein
VRDALPVHESVTIFHKVMEDGVIELVILDVDSPATGWP